MKYGTESELQQGHVKQPCHASHLAEWPHMEMSLLLHAQTKPSVLQNLGTSPTISYLSCDGVPTATKPINALALQMF